MNQKHSISIGVAILLAVFLNVTSVSGQDTLFVYFGLGSSKLFQAEQEKLDAISIGYDLSDVDSIHFVGRADSVGNYKSNLKLSAKRAKTVAKWCKHVVPERIPMRVFAKGETTGKSQNNRRVEVILYKHFHELPADTLVIKSDEIPEEPVEANWCCRINYDLLLNCSQRAVRKRRKDMVLLEAETDVVEDKKGNYYGYIDGNGLFQVKRLKWRTRRTGNLWWAKSRLVAEVPATSFERYRIFTISDGNLPCDTCGEKISSDTKKRVFEKCLQIDGFLMDHIQVKNIWFKNGWIKVRAPKEYVDLNSTYYLGCKRNIEVEWSAKKGKRNRPYYFTKIHWTSLGHTENTSLARDMECCAADGADKGCEKPYTWWRGCGGTQPGVYINIESGMYVNQHDPRMYLGLNTEMVRRKTRYNLITGVNHRLNFYGSLSSQMRLLYFRFSMFNPANQWQDAKTASGPSRLIQLYVGSQVKTSLGLENIVNHNFNVGLASDGNSVTRWSRVFIQYEYGVDYLTYPSLKPYSSMSLGVRYTLHRSLFK